MGPSDFSLTLKMPVLRLPLCLALLVLVLDLLLPPAEACFTCTANGRKKREAATGLLCLAPQWSRRRRLPLQPVTPTRLRDSPGRRSNSVRRSTCCFWPRLGSRLRPKLTSKLPTSMAMEPCSSKSGRTGRLNRSECLYNFSEKEKHSILHFF